MKPPVVIGVIGGVASGKSEATRRLEQLGARVIHADAIGHEVLRDPQVIESLRTRFGDGIVDGATGDVDRVKVALLVFGQDAGATANRRFLESVVHPRIRTRIGELLDDAMADKGLRAIVLDVPLLIESGWVERCDHVLLIDTPATMRRARAIARGWTAQQFADRESSQLDLEAKRRAATVTIDNSGTLDALRERIDAWWSTIT